MFFPEVYLSAGASFWRFTHTAQSIATGNYALFSAGENFLSMRQEAHEFFGSALLGAKGHWPAQTKQPSAGRRVFQAWSS